MNFFLDEGTSFYVVVSGLVDQASQIGDFAGRNNHAHGCSYRLLVSAASFGRKPIVDKSATVCE